MAVSYTHLDVYKRQLLKPMTLFVVITSIISYIQAYVQVLILTEGGPGTATYLSSYIIYNEAFVKYNFGYASAMSFVCLLYTSYQCLEKCDKKTIPYCITKALVNSAEGNTDEGLVFCGSNAFRAERIETVDLALIHILATRRFCFEAFLPSDKKEKQWILEELKRETRTIIIYEAPHRLVRTLEELRVALGNRRITICRELTKRYETAFQTTFEDAMAAYETEEPRGECVIVIEGKSIGEIKEERMKSFEEMSLEEHMDLYEKQGIERKEAMRMVAKDRGISKRDVYQQLMK